MQGDQGRIISVSRKLGREVLNDGAINKGTAFPESERERMHIRGLLPPAVSSLELQVGHAQPHTTEVSTNTAQGWGSLTHSRNPTRSLLKCGASRLSSCWTIRAGSPHLVRAQGGDRPGQKVDNTRLPAGAALASLGAFRSGCLRPA